MTTSRRSPLSWLLLIALALVVGFTAFQIVRSVRAYAFWQAHADEPIQPWMTIGFVAHSYHLPPHVLLRAVGLSQGPPPDHRPLDRIATAKGVPFALVKARLQYAIVHSRPPYPPPPPPARHKPGGGR